MNWDDDTPAFENWEEWVDKPPSKPLSDEGVKVFVFGVQALELACTTGLAFAECLMLVKKANKRAQWHSSGVPDSDIDCFFEAVGL